MASFSDHLELPGRAEPGLRPPGQNFATNVDSEEARNVLLGPLQIGYLDLVHMITSVSTTWPPLPQ